MVALHTRIAGAPETSIQFRTAGKQLGALGVGTDYRKGCVACTPQDVVAAIAALRRTSEEMIQVEQRQRSGRSSLANIQGAGEGAENRDVDFPSVFACSRVLKFAIGSHEVICLQSVSITVIEEVAAMPQATFQKGSRVNSRRCRHPQPHEFASDVA